MVFYFCVDWSSKFVNSKHSCWFPVGEFTGYERTHFVWFIHLEQVGLTCFDYILWIFDVDGLNLIVMIFELLDDILFYIQWKFLSCLIAYTFAPEDKTIDSLVTEPAWPVIIFFLMWSLCQIVHEGER